MKLRELWAVHDFLLIEIDHQKGLGRTTVVSYLNKKIKDIEKQIDEGTEEMERMPEPSTLFPYKS